MALHGSFLFLKFSILFIMDFLHFFFLLKRHRIKIFLLITDFSAPFLNVALKACAHPSPGPGRGHNCGLTEAARWQDPGRRALRVGDQWSKPHGVASLWGGQKVSESSFPFC